MVQLDYLQRRKRKKVAAWVSGISSVVLAVLCIVAFLGTYVGTFTVSLKTSNNAKISLSESHDMSNPTTYLRLSKLPQFDTYTANAFTGHDKIDSDETDYLLGLHEDPSGKRRYLSFLKYTFFVQNSGDVTVDFSFEVKITDNKKPDNVDYDLTDIVRVRLYDHSAASSEHDYVTYAKRDTEPHYVSGEPSYEKPIAGKEGTATFCGYAKEFVDDTTCLSKSVYSFLPMQMKRYTVVIWIEGEDKLVVGAPPENGSIKFAVNISGYGVDETK